MNIRWAWLVVAVLFVPGASAGADDTATIVKKLKDRGAKFDYSVTPNGDNPEQVHAHQITDAELELVAQLKTLRIVNLQSNANITDEGIKRLVGMESLESLDITGTKVTPAGLAHIAKIKKLDRLGCGQQSMTDDMLRELIRLNIAYKLSLCNSVGPGHPTSNDDVNWIQLHSAQLTDEGLKLLNVFKNATVIDLSGPNWTAAGLKHLAPLKGLTDLNPKPMSDAAFKALREVGMIHALFCAHTATGQRPRSEKEVTSFLFHPHYYHSVTGAGVRELAHLPNLERLDLSSVDLGDAAMKDVAALKGLKRLDTGRRVTDEGLKELTELKLHTLTFWTGARLTDAGMKHIGRIKTLRALILWDSKVTNSGLKELKGLKLHTLTLKPEGINDETLRLLREMNLLHALGDGPRGKRPESADDVVEIDLDRTRVTDEGLKQLIGFRNLKWVGGSNYTTKKALDALGKKLPDLDP